MIAWRISNAALRAAEMEATDQLYRCCAPRTEAEGDFFRGLYSNAPIALGNEHNIFL
jgi:hypothetical protein